MSLSLDELERFATALARSPERWHHLVRHALAGRPVSREIGPGTTFTLPPVAIHRVLHAGSGPAVTVHCYSPPLRRTGAYSVGADGTLERESQTFEVELRGEPAAA
jgi:hypothetical protein